MELELAPDVKQLLVTIKARLEFPQIDLERVTCFRSYGSRSRAQARIWSFPKIWQLALGQPSHYCIEVLSEKFDKLSRPEKTKILIHELLHIPKNFSGALLPHRGRGRRVINSHLVNKLFKQYNSKP
jgi:predicted metallopeptidase